MIIFLAWIWLKHGHKYPPKPQVRPGSPTCSDSNFPCALLRLACCFLQHVNGSPTCVHKSCTAQQIALIWNRLSRTNSSFCSMVKDRQMPPTMLYVRVNLHRTAINKGFPEKFPISTCSVNRTLHDRNKVIGCPFIHYRSSKIGQLKDDIENWSDMLFTMTEFVESFKIAAGKSGENQSRDQNRSAFRIIRTVPNRFSSTRNRRFGLGDLGNSRWNNKSQIN